MMPTIRQDQKKSVNQERKSKQVSSANKFILATQLKDE